TELICSPSQCSDVGILSIQNCYRWQPFLAKERVDQTVLGQTQRPYGILCSAFEL
uniref:Uncharacterized protein n=1 Tax=Aegilops tauschii subsp. strangulata TaxID=200361 RepID=A0A453R725_AEGTS